MYNKLQKTQFRKKKLDTITKNFLILPGFKESEKKLVPPPKKKHFWLFSEVRKFRD